MPTNEWPIINDDFGLGSPVTVGNHLFYEERATSAVACAFQWVLSRVVSADDGVTTFIHVYGPQTIYLSGPGVGPSGLVPRSASTVFDYC